jgi:hypothetical protein
VADDDAIPVLIYGEDVLVIERCAAGSRLVSVKRERRSVAEACRRPRLSEWHLDEVVHPAGIAAYSSVEHVSPTDGGRGPE